MSDEGGTWNSDGGQRWDAGFTVLQEVDLTRDLNRSEEWSDISDDESPAVYADISHSAAHHYHTVQPKETLWDSSYLSHVSSAALHGTPTASSFPYQESLFWRQQQQQQHPQDVLPGVASGSTEYPLAPYPSTFYPSPFYPPAICQMVQENPVAYSLDERGEIEKEEKKKNRNVSFVEQTVVKHKEDRPKKSGQQRFETEGKELVTSSLASGPTSKVATLDTTGSGFLPLEGPYSQNPSSSGQKHNYSDTRMSPKSDASMFHREGQYCERNNALISREPQGGSKQSVPHLECKNVSVPLVAGASEVQEIIQKDTHHQALCNSDTHETEAGDIGSEGFTFSLQYQSPTQDQSKQGRGPKRKVELKGNKTQDISDVQPSTDKTLKKEKRMSSPSESIPAIFVENRAVVTDTPPGTSTSEMLSKGSKIQDNSDVQTYTDKALVKEMGTLSPPESTPVISDEKRAVVPDQHVGTSKPGEVKRKVTPKRSKLQDSHDTLPFNDDALTKEVGTSSPTESTPVISDEKRAVVPDQHVGTSKSGEVERKVTPKRSKLQDSPDALPLNDDSLSKGMGTSSPPESTPVISDENRDVVPDQHRGPSKSGEVNRKVTQKRSRLENNPDTQPSNDDALTKEMGTSSPPESTPAINDDKRSIVADQRRKTSEKVKTRIRGKSLYNPDVPSCVTNETLVEELGVPSPPALSNEKRPAVPDQHNGASEGLGLDKPGEDSTNISSSAVTQQASLASAERDSVKNGGSRRLGMGLTGILMKQKKKAGRPFKKKTLLKMAKLLEIAKECDTTGTYVNETTDAQLKDDVQRQNTTLSSSNEQSGPSSSSIPCDVKEYIYNLSISPLPKTPIQDPKAHPPMSLKDLLENSKGQEHYVGCSKTGAAITQPKAKSTRNKKVLRKRRKTKELSISRVCQDLKVAPETVFARGTRQSSARIKKAHKKKMSRKAEECSQSSILASPQKPVHQQKATKRIQVQGAEGEKLAKGSDVSDTQTESELPCDMNPEVESMDSSEFPACDMKPEVESMDSSEVSAECHARDLRKWGRGPKRKGKAKRRGRFRTNPIVLPVNETVVPETLPERSAKLPQIALKENVKKTSKKTAGNKERQNRMGSMDSNGLSAQKDVSCDKEEDSQTLNISQPLGEKKGRKRKAKYDEDDGLNQNNCSTNQISELRMNVDDQFITQPKSARLGSNVEPVLKEDGGSHHKTEGNNTSEPVITDNLLESDSTKAMTNAAQKTLQTPKSCKSKRKGGIPKVEPPSQDKTGIMGIDETLPKTSTPRKTKKAVEVVPIDNEVQSSTPNSSFDFAEEEFLVPVIKVSPRKDVSLEMTMPKQSCIEMSTKNSARIKEIGRRGATKSRTSQETRAISSEVKPEPLVTPCPISKPVDKQTGKHRKLETDSQDSGSQIMIENSTCSTTEDHEGGKSTEIKMEQAEFALSAVDTRAPAVSSHSSMQTTDYMAMLKRKPGRPFKKKTLLRMAKILEIVHEAGSEENDGIANFVEGILPKKQTQPKVKKEKVRPLVSPTRRSLRTSDPAKSESEPHSLSTISVDTDQEGNTVTSSSSSTVNRSESSPDKCSPNTLPSDSTNEATMNETDKQDPERKTEAESIAVRTLKKRRKRKVLNPKKKKVGWRKLCPQLTNMTALQEASNSEDTACVSSNNIEISCKVSSLPLSCKEEQLEQAILKTADTSKSDSAEEPQILKSSLRGSEERTKSIESTLTQSKRGRRGRLRGRVALVEDSHISMEVADATANPEKEDTDLNARPSLIKVERKTGCTLKKSNYLKKSKLTAVVEAVSESPPQIKSLNLSGNSTKVKAEESEQSVSATQALRPRRSSRGLSSASFSSADKGPRQSKANLEEESQEEQSSKLGETSLNESKRKDDDSSLEIQNDDVSLPFSDVPEHVSMPGQLKQKKTRRGRKRKLYTRTRGVAESAKITDTTNNSDESPTVALNSSECHSTSAEDNNTSKKSTIVMGKTASGEMDAPSVTKIEKGMDNLGETFLNETKAKDNDSSLEIQSDDVTLSSSDVQEHISMPGQLKQKKTRRGRKRKLNSRTCGVVESAKIIETTDNLNASLDSSECLSTSVEDDSTSKKSKILMENPASGKMNEPSGTEIEKGMNKRGQKTLLESSENEPAHASSEKADPSTCEEPPKSSSEATPRRSVRASKVASRFYRSEECTPAVGESTSSPEKDCQNVIKNPKKPTKTLLLYLGVPAQAQVLSAISSDVVETASGLSVSGNKPTTDLEPSTAKDNEITEAEASSTLVDNMAETVKKKKRRSKIKGWGNRRYAKGKSTSAVLQKNEKPAVQSNVTVITEEKSSTQSSQLDDSEPYVEELFLSEPQEDSDEESPPIQQDNLLIHSSCQTLFSLVGDSQSPQDVQEVDGCTQYSEEACREQRVMSPKSPSRLNVGSQDDKKSRTSIKCKFCGQSFRHISAYTVHRRLHTGDKPYQCKHCGKRFAQVSKLKSHKNVHKAGGSIQCPCCSQQFSKKEQLINHFKVHLPSVDQVSSTETKTLESPSKPSSLLTNSSSSAFNCCVCGKDFPSEQKLHIHRRAHKGERLSCKDCGKTFRKQTSLSAHERVHWPLKPYACSICGKGFSKVLALKAHSLQHTGETPFFCSRCGYACSDLPTLRAHQASRICSVKKQDDTEGFLIQMGVDGQVNTPNLFKCHLCKKLLNHWCQYTLHLQTHTKTRPYLCHMCGQSYDTHSDVRVHCRACCESSGEEKACLGPLSDIWTSQETGEISLTSQDPASPEHMEEQSFVSPDNSPVHPDPLSENGDPIGSYNIQPPSPTPSNVSILSSHPSLDCYIVSSIHAHTRTRKRFECQHCSQTFRLFSFLRAHLRTHLPGNKYTCGLCGRVFQRWHKLWLHQRLHQQKGKSFTCSDCNVQFHFLGLYREHLREHAEQRPYACPLCPETFLSEENLNAHQCENHRTRRTLRCEVCGKGFSSLRNWVKHSMLHNGRSSHRCLLCDHSFASNCGLQDHLKTHNNDLRFPTSEIPSEPLLFPYKCWHCKASFSSGELLHAHQICHAVGGRPPVRPKDTPTSHRNTGDITKTAPPPNVPESSSVPEPPAAKRAPAPVIPEESLFHYAHPDSLYVVPDPTPPVPRHTHSFSRSRGPSCSRASNATSSQLVITLDEDSPPDATDTNLNVPGTSQTIPDSSLNADLNLPQTSSRQSVTESPSEAVSPQVSDGSPSASHLQGEPTLSLQVKHTLPPGHDKLGDAVKHFSITVQLQDSRGFECADCNVSLSSIKQLHKHYLKHAKGVLTKPHV